MTTRVEKRTGGGRSDVLSVNSFMEKEADQREAESLGLCARSSHGRPPTVSRTIHEWQRAWMKTRLRRSGPRTCECTCVTAVRTCSEQVYLCMYSPASLARFRFRVRERNNGMRRLHREVSSFVDFFVSRGKLFVKRSSGCEIVYPLNDLLRNSLSW